MDLQTEILGSPAAPARQEGLGRPISSAIARHAWPCVRLMALASALAALTACGQKGRLYLPDAAKSPATSASAALPASSPLPAR